MKETLYKLTKADKTTYGGMLWGEGVTNQAIGTGGLCTNGVIHSYRSPLLAILLNPIHGDYKNPLLWEASCPQITHDDGTKLGSKELTTIKQMPLPAITIRQRVIFAILCAEAAIVLVNMPFEAQKHIELWQAWAKNYKNRSAARNASSAAAVAARDAADYAASAAAYAASAVRAADYVADYAAARAAIYAVRAADYAARAADYAASAASAASAAIYAASAADCAVRAAKLDLISLVEQAMRY